MTLPQQVNERNRMTKTGTLLTPLIVGLLVLAPGASASEVTLTQEVGKTPNFPRYAGNEYEAGRWLLNEELGETSAYPFTSLGTAKVAISTGEVSYRVKAVSTAFTLRMYGAHRFYNPVKLHVLLRLGKHVVGYYGPYLQCTPTYGCPKQLLAETQLPEQPPNEHKGEWGWESSMTTVPYATYPLEVVAPTRTLKAKALYLETFASGFQTADGTGCTESWTPPCAKYYQLRVTTTLTLEIL